MEPRLAMKVRGLYSTMDGGESMWSLLFSKFDIAFNRDLSLLILDLSSSCRDIYY